jgi:hypothetical protein
MTTTATVRLAALQASAVFVPAPLLEDAAQEVSEPAQQAEAARCLH